MALSKDNPVFLVLPIPICLNRSPILLATSYLFSPSTSYHTGSVVVEMFCQRLSSGWWGGTLRVLDRLIIRGHELQSHFILIAERWAWTLNVLLLSQLFSTAWRCVWNFICPMEERVIHLGKKKEKRRIFSITFFICEITTQRSGFWSQIKTKYWVYDIKIDLLIMLNDKLGVHQSHYCIQYIYMNRPFLRCRATAKFHTFSGHRNSHTFL